MIYFMHTFRDGKVLKVKGSSANLLSASTIGCFHSFTYVLMKRDRMIALLQSLEKLILAAKQEQQCELPCEIHTSTLE